MSIGFCFLFYICCYIFTIDSSQQSIIVFFFYQPNKSFSSMPRRWHQRTRSTAPTSAWDTAAATSHLSFCATCSRIPAGWWLVWLNWLISMTWYAHIFLLLLLKNVKDHTIHTVSGRVVSRSTGELAQLSDNDMRSDRSGDCQCVASRRGHGRRRSHDHVFQVSWPLTSLFAMHIL